MSGRVLFTCKPLSLSVVAALATLSVPSSEALLLPPKPLALSSSWDCKSNSNNDWLCRRNSENDYNQPLENVSRQAYQPIQAQSSYLPAQPENTMPARKEYNPVYPSSEEPVYNTPYQPAPTNPQYYYPQSEPQSEPQYRPQQYQQQPAAPRRQQYEPPPPVRSAPTERILPTPNFQPSTVATTETTNMNRVLNASHGSYVLQWLAAHNPKPLQDLQNYYPVLQEATIVQYRRNGKDWYVLLDGPYKDRHSAMSALKTVPRSSMINKLYPWTRSVASIQKLDIVRPDIVNPNNEQNIVADQYPVPVGSPQPAETMFASIAPAYPNIEKEPQHSSYGYPDYNTPEPSSAYSHDQQRFQSERNYSSSSRREQIYQQDSLNERRRPERYKRQKENNRVLDAPAGSYTIQWLASAKRTTLERVRQRYPYLEDTQIVQYRKRDREWFVLVSQAFYNETHARQALEQPAYARIATRLYPRVRSIDNLRQQVNMQEPVRQRQSAVIRSYKPEPSRQPRQVRPRNPVQQILTSSDGTYTIQWFAANKPESIEKMKQRFPELASAVTVHYRRNQKDWYVLLQGQYGSSSEALSIIKSPLMQNAVRVLHPWTRPITSLKKLSVRES